MTTAIIVGFALVTYISITLVLHWKERNGPIHLDHHTVERMEGRRTHLSDKGWEVIDIE